MSRELKEERNEWRHLGWDAAAARSSWPDEVPAAIRAYFERGGPMIQPASLVRVGTAQAGEVPVVDVVYHHSYHPRGPVGLRMRVGEPPLRTLGMADGDTVLDRFVFVVCYLTIGEPPGASADAYIRDDAGVWWHRYGFTEPELGERGYSETRSARRRRTAGLVRSRQSRWTVRRRS